MRIFATAALVDGAIGPALLELADGRIATVRTDGEALAGAATADVRLDGGFLVPGLIDVQINGAFGFDFTECSTDEARDVLQQMPLTGTTAICPTVITAPHERLLQQLQRLRPLAEDEGGALRARSLGVHLEGPYISPSRRGAHDPHSVRPIAMDELTQLLHTGALRILTLAPELPDAVAAIRRLREAGLLVSLGHSNATAEEAHAAAAAGASMVTHVFNAQTTMRQREPGISLGALVDPRLTIGIIADGRHVHYDLLRLVLAAVGVERTCVVSDATAALGCDAGSHLLLGGEPVVVHADGLIRREDGTIAGATRTQLESIEAAAAQGIDRVALLRAATEVPADLVGRDDLGRIAPGARADLVHYDTDPAVQVRTVWIDGREWA